MKKLLTILLLLIIITLQTQCDQSEVENYAPEIQTNRSLQMGDFLNATIREEENSTDVFLDLELTYTPEDQNGEIEYAFSQIFINDIQAGGFYENKCTAQVREFGSLEFKIKFLNSASEVVHEVSENLDIHISTFYLDTREDAWYAARRMVETENIELYDQSHANGGHAVCWMYNLRIPEGESLTFTPEIEYHVDINPWQNKLLTVHFRFKDYKNSQRNALYTPPDEAMFHIDKET
ncbi:MAG: hypothetical protein U9N54_11630, partial [candidate division Zixibacteria bacterium]|nr:hypothetical protein [candidate division Zixibacteria bacterium]